MSVFNIVKVMSPTPTVGIVGFFVNVMSYYIRAICISF